MRSAERFSGNDEFTPRQRQRGSARYSHEGGNAEHAEDERKIEDRLPDKGDDSQHEDERRKGQQHVHRADDKSSSPAAEITRKQAERAPDSQANHRRAETDRKSTRLNSSHLGISYAVFCLKKKKKT